jgi:hypothetical protein
MIYILRRNSTSFIRDLGNYFLKPCKAFSVWHGFSRIGFSLSVWSFADYIKIKRRQAEARPTNSEKAR